MSSPVAQGLAAGQPHTEGSAPGAVRGTWGWGVAGAGFSGPSHPPAQALRLLGLFCSVFSTSHIISPSPRMSPFYR